MRHLVTLLLTGFLCLFLLCPLLGLLLASVVGQQVPVLQWLWNFDLFGAVSFLKENGTLQYFREFLATPRYYLGFLNAVGLAPTVVLLVFCLGWLGEKLFPASAVLWRRLRGPILPLLFGGILLVAATRPLWAAEESLWGKLFSSEQFLLRSLQACGYTPLVTLAATVVGVGVALALGRTNMPGRRFFTLLVVVPLSMPPFLGALAFKNLLGDFGMLTRACELLHLSHPFVARSPLSAATVEVFLFFPFVTLTTLAALERFDESLPEASRGLGGTGLYTFLTVTIPTLLPGILAGTFLVFVRTFGDFATLYLLLPTDYPVLVIEAYRDYLGGSYWGGAATLSVLMVSVILVLLALQKYVVEGGSFQTLSGRAGRPTELERKKRTWRDYLALLYCCGVFVVPLSFLASIFLISVAKNWGAQVFPTEFTFNRYRLLVEAYFTEYDSPLVNSFSLTIPALLGCMAISFAIAYLISRTSNRWSQFLDFLTVLPFVIPGVAFAVALIGVFNGEPLPLHFTAILAIFAYMVTRAPYGVRTVLASFQQIGTSMEESSRTLGGSEPLTLARITLPLVFPGIMAGASMVFISAMQDVAITLLVAPPDWFPTSVYVFQEIERGRIYNASAYGIVLFVLILVPYSVAYFSKRLRVGL